MKTGGMEKSFLRKGLLLVPLLLLLTGCFDWLEDELTKKKKVNFSGRVVEAFNSNLPIDSVKVEVCSENLLLLLFPFTSQICEGQIFTDSDGYFDLSLKLESLDLYYLKISKPGYFSLDSCIKINNELECYMEAYPTRFRLLAGSSREAFDFDSASIRIQYPDFDTLFTYVSAESVIGEDTVTVWNGAPNGPPTYFRDVEGNSTVFVFAHYFKDASLLLTESPQIFCPKGIGGRYIMRNKLE
jgi:hypothetical protein